MTNAHALQQQVVQQRMVCTGATDAMVIKSKGPYQNRRYAGSAENFP